MNKDSKKRAPKPKLFSMLGEICKIIPTHLVPKLARETGVDQKARTFSPWSHVLSLMYVQLFHSLSLNDVCDALGMLKGRLQWIRGAKAPTRNTFSYANRNRDPEMARQLFWKVLEHLQTISPSFSRGSRGAFAFRFKRLIHLVDSSTITLIAHSMDWAKHRRRKAATKCHVRLDLQSMLPRFVVVEAANEHDSQRTLELCHGVKEGEIVVFDKAYVVFIHLMELTRRGIFWVSRAKDNLQYRAVKNNPVCGNILQDQVIRLTGATTPRDYHQTLRRVVAIVEVDGKPKEMVFITNQMEWAPSSVCDLYRCRWQIEVFFKQIKQTLQLADFLGYNENAVKWQIWIALLVYVLLRFIAHLHRWSGSFTRLFTLLRASLWMSLSPQELLKRYGTAHPKKRRIRAHPERCFLPGMIRFMTS
jgi:hypothetical protein